MRALPFTEASLRTFCTRWKIVELSVFGSFLRDDFGPDSDVDLLVRFAPDSAWSLLDVAQLKLELEAHFRRTVDVVEAGTLRNPFRRHAIETSREVVYAA